MKAERNSIGADRAEKLYQGARAVNWRQRNRR